MNRELKIDYVKWNTRHVKSHGMWVLVSRQIDLKDIQVGKIYNCVLSQLLDGRYVLEEIVGIPLREFKPKEDGESEVDNNDTTTGS